MNREGEGRASLESTRRGALYEQRRGEASEDNRDI